MKNKSIQRMFALALTLVLCCGAIPAAFAAEADTAAPIPDIVLYYGKVEAISHNEDGNMTALRMTSDRYGEYVMLLSEDTVWIDSGKHTASDPASLQEGERLYVFHSSNSTRSMPPQSAAFAIVRNVPQDASCARYHEVEAVEKHEDGTVQITTDNGGLFLAADEETVLLNYAGNTLKGLEEIITGSYIMAWYGPMVMSYPGQARAGHIMVLPRLNAALPLTRSSFAVMLHTAQGNPVVNSFMNFTDVDPDAPYADAIHWAASEKLISGYDDGRIGPNDLITREQLLVILWRQAGSPMLMDYPGLTKYSDVGDISRFAQPALAWAHQKGLVPAEGRLGPKDTVTETEAEMMVAALDR